MDADLVKLIVALALIGANAGIAASTALPSAAKAPKEPRRARRRPLQISGAAPPGEAVAHALPAPGVTRPRIFTGEPGADDQRRRAGARALKLVGGIAALAAVGAIGLLALARAIVEMFEQIGG